MAIATDLAAVNAALYRVGATEITAIDSNSDYGRIALALYDSTRDEVCRVLPWSSLIVRGDMTEETVVSNPTTFDKSYDLGDGLSPACLRVIDVDGKSNIPYSIEGDYLYTNDTSGKLRYIGQQAADSQADWDSLLLDSVVARLASKMAFRIVKDLNLSAMLMQEYITLLGIAVKVEAVEGAVKLADLLTFMQEVNPMILLRSNQTTE